MVCRYGVKPVYFCDDSQLFDTIDTKEKIWCGCMVWMRGGHPETSMARRNVRMSAFIHL